MKKIGIIGCGTMGSQIALLASSFDFNVTVISKNQLSIDKGINKINALLENIFWKRHLNKKDINTVLSNIIHSTDLTSIKECYLVIECINERLQDKINLVTDVLQIIDHNVIFATNTSSQNLNLLDPENKLDIVGLHFFNPVINSKILEFIITSKTSDETILLIEDFLNRIERKHIKLNGKSSFLVNRLLLPYVLNAIRELEQTNLDPVEIDNAVKLSFNFPMGPLETCDFVGLDLVLETTNNLYLMTKHDSYKAPELLISKVKSNQLGIKTGVGFYNYN